MCLAALSINTTSTHSAKVPGLLSGSSPRAFAKTARAWHLPLSISNPSRALLIPCSFKSHSNLAWIRNLSK